MSTDNPTRAELNDRRAAAERFLMTAYQNRPTRAFVLAKMELDECNLAIRRLNGEPTNGE
jgi:hypothetical protein